VRDILLYGVAGGLLIAVLKLTEYRFLVVEHSVEIYGALVAALFAGLGIWLGQTLTRKKPAVIIKEVPAQAPVQPMGPFVADETRVSQLGITPREMEILGLIATGLNIAVQPGDCRAAIRQRKHGEDAFEPAVSFSSRQHLITPTSRQDVQQTNPNNQIAVPSSSRLFFGENPFVDCAGT
jgi:hypothetical protein